MADWQQAAPASAAPPLRGSDSWQSAAPAIPPDADNGLAHELVSNSPGVKDATNPLEAFQAGLQMSATSLLKSKPNLQVPTNASFFQKLSASIGQGLGDLPFNVAGAVGGGAAGGAAGSEVPVVGNVIGAAVGGGAGMMALPQAVRETMMDYYADKDKGVMTASDFMHQVAQSAWNVGKASVIGAISGGVAGKATSLVADAGGGAFATTATNVSAFTAAATGTQAAIDQHVPDAQDFAIAAIGAVAFAGGGHLVSRPGAPAHLELTPAGEAVKSNATQIYRQTGVPPWQQAAAAKTDPVLHQEMMAQDVNGDANPMKFNTQRAPEPEPFKPPPQQGAQPKNAANGLVVARQMPNGTVKYGKPGDMHFNLYEDHEFEQKGIGSVGMEDKTMGFAQPGGPFLSREQAAASIGQREPLESGKNEAMATAAHVEQLLPQVRGLEGSGDHAISPKGAIGRFQIMPGTARQYGFDPEKLMDPAYNETVARHVLADLSKRFNGDTEAVLIAYNAGPGRAMTFIRNGRQEDSLPLETQKYVVKAGFGKGRSISKSALGEGGAPPNEPPPPSEPPAGPEGPDWKALNTDMRLSRFQDAIGQEPTKPAMSLAGMTRYWVSELDSAKGIDRTMIKRGLLDPKTDMTTEDMFRQTYASDDRAEHFFYKGGVDPITFDATNHPALTDVISKIKDVGGSIDEFNLYRVAARTVEKHAQGIDTGVFKGGVEEAAASLQDPNLQKYKAVNELMQQWKDGPLQYFKDSGMSNDARIQAMKDANTSHVSLRRIMGDDASFKAGTQGKSKFAASNPLKKMEGSDRQIVEPLTADMDNARQMIRMADRNRAIGHVLGSQENIDTLGLVKLPAPQVKAMLAEPGSDVFKPYNMTPKQQEAMAPFAIQSNKNATTGNRFTFFRNGVPEVWEAKDPDVAALFRGADSPGEADIISKMMSFPAKMERAGIMGAPDIAFRVPMRHQLTAWVLDPLHPPPYIIAMRGAMDAFGQGDKFWELMRRGGASGAITDIDDNVLKSDFQKTMEETGAGEKMWNTVKDPLHLAQLVTERLTLSARLGYYDRGVAMGLPPNKVATMGRKAYLDYSEKATGNLANMMAKWIPFFRSVTLGMKQGYEAVSDNPVQTLKYATLGLMVPQIAMYALNRGADQFLDDKDKYTSLPQWERDQYFVTPRIGGMRFKLQRPYVIGPAIGVPLERALEKMFEDNPNAFDGLLSSVASDMVPGVIPAAVKPVLEQISNHNFFTGKSLIPDSLKDNTPDLQYTDNTTEVSKRISALLGSHTGLGIADVSPTVLDNYVQEWAGTIGMTILHALDTPLGHVNGPFEVADIPFVKGFVLRNPKMNTQTINDFYTDAQKFQSLNKDVSLEVKAGNLDQAMQDKSGAGPKAIAASHIEHALSVQRTALKAINANPKMTVDEKRQLSERIYQDAWQIARFGSQLLRGQATEAPAGLEDRATADVEAANGQ